MKLARPLIVALLTFAVVVLAPVVVATTNVTATRLQQETAAAAAAQDPAAVEASLALDRPAQRLIQSLLKQVWVGMAPVRCRPSQKNPRVRGLCFAP